MAKHVCVTPKPRERARRGIVRIEGVAPDFKILIVRRDLPHACRRASRTGPPSDASAGIGHDLRLHALNDAVLSQPIVKPSRTVALGMHEQRFLPCELDLHRHARDVVMSAAWCCTDISFSLPKPPPTSYFSTWQWAKSTPSSEHLGASCAMTGQRSRSITRRRGYQPRTRSSRNACSVQRKWRESTESRRRRFGSRIWIV